MKAEAEIEARIAELEDYVSKSWDEDAARMALAEVRALKWVLGK